MPTLTATEYLKVNGIPLATPAWRVDDLSPLMSENALRGDDRIIPGAAGVRAKRRRRTVTVLSFGLHVFGLYDQDGAIQADARQGLINNIAYLKANLGAASAIGNGTVTAEWHQPSGAVKTASVHVLGPHDPHAQSPNWVHFMLDLSIPVGFFT